MIRPKYTRAILNALFHARGSYDTEADAELAELIAAGVPESGAPHLAYWVAFQQDGYTKNGERTAQYNAYRDMVDNSEYWHTWDNGSYTYTYTEEVGGVEKEYTVTLSGWGISRRVSQQVSYPSSAYLALFTAMPDGNGKNYTEPTVGADGSATTYIRVNLHRAIISGGVCINNAQKDPGTGAAVLDNSELFVYPEVFGVTLGTVVGFGVMETEEAGTGAAVVWGRLTEPIDTKLERVLLFRTGDFKMTLQ